MINISVKGKELFKKGYVDGYYNNVKMEMLDGSGLIITNENIVGESLCMTERTCSGNTLKFGLCEAKSLEIECFDIPNIKGKRFFLSIEKIRSEDNMIIDRIQYGEFLVNSCKRQSFSGRRKIIAYDDLKSSTLDKDMAEEVNLYIENKEDFIQPCIFQVEKDLLKKFGISTKEKENVETTWITSTKGQNTYGPDDNMGYFVYEESRYLSYTLDPVEYYTFKISDVLQEERERQVQQILKSYKMKFTGMEAAWLDQLCYIRITSEDGKELNYVGSHGDEKEYTGIKYVTVFVADSLTIKNQYGEEKTKISFGYEDAIEDIRIHRINLKTMEKVRMKEKVQNMTLRNILTSIYELQAKFGRMNRKTGLLEFVQLNSGGLHPADTLYPSDKIYPSGGSNIDDGMIENIWMDENGGIKYGRLKLSYIRIGENGDKEEAIYEYTFDDKCNKTYEVSDNWILKNIIMTDEEIQKVAQEMGQGMIGVEVLPFSADIVGIPYVESGDMIEISDGIHTKKVYILERTISGIQGMKDSLEALGGG